MNDLFEVFIFIVGLSQGVCLGYYIWAPMSTFKKGFIEGLTFSWFRKKDKK